MSEQENTESHFYRVVVKCIKQGATPGMSWPQSDTVYSGVTWHHALEMAHSRLRLNPDSQVTIEDNNFIVAINVGNRMLLLSRVPPMKYWLNYRKRPDPIIPETERKIAACGLPIPAALCEQL